ncbi:hypothetical protein KRR26_13480 [Corallococcus sp. M34]|uniref:hypothetical protein n=1 Tax=Citreicoccus inhibens TaxID=2849499 RepID=UPI0018F2F2C5|nr:hypothetical protein [Citreicoccus inhibens]MBU8896626.1 hypothetical protein [Citreicoccus inhibens]
MSPRLSLALAAACLALPASSRAEDNALTPEKVAEIRRDESKAQAKVDAANGNRKPSELSSAERKEVIRQQSEASSQVLAKHGVSAKEYARYTARMGREESAQADAAQKRQDEAAKVAAQEAAKKPPEGAANGEIPIQRGFSDAEPVELEATADAPPVVEVGLPGEALPAAGDEVAAAPEEAEPLPTKAVSRSSKKGGGAKKSGGAKYGKRSH